MEPEWRHSFRLEWSRLCSVEPIELKQMEGYLNINLHKREVKPSFASSHACLEAKIARYAIFCIRPCVDIAWKDLVLLGNSASNFRFQVAFQFFLVQWLNHAHRRLRLTWWRPCTDLNNTGSRIQYILLIKFLSQRRHLGRYSRSSVILREKLHEHKDIMISVFFAGLVNICCHFLPQILPWFRLNGSLVAAILVLLTLGEKPRIPKYRSLYMGRNSIQIPTHIASQNMARNIPNIPWYYQLLYALEYWWYSGVFAEQNICRIWIINSHV